MRTILIAESELIISLDIKIFLERNNFLITGIVSTTDDLIKKYKLHQPDLVITHLHLKGSITGEEAIKQICSLDSTPVIIISSSTIRKLKKISASLNQCWVIAKPFDGNELLKLVKKIFAVKKSSL
jgi:two-component system, response regulator PdtaR